MVSAGFTAQEDLGRQLFMDVKRGNCQACHTRNIFVPQGGQNNGVDGSIGAGQKFKWTAWSTRDDYRGKDSGFAGVIARGNYSGVLGRDSNAVKTNIGRMKVPSLINIGLTAPYMHDGRFKTLDDVINFYSDSIKNNDYNTLSAFFRSIDPRTPGAPNNVQPANQLAIDTAPVRVIHYTVAEKAALKAFLLTLTDTGFIKDPKFSNPFCVTSTTATAKTSPTESFQLKEVLSLNAVPNPMGLSITSINGQTFLGSVNVYTIDGRLVAQRGNLFSMGSNNFTFPLLASGEYIITIEAHNSVVYSKQIII